MLNIRQMYFLSGLSLYSLAFLYIKCRFSEHGEINYSIHVYAIGILPLKHVSMYVWFHRKELPALRRTQPTTKRPKFLPTTHVKMLQWLHGQQQQHKATCIRIYSRGRGRDRTPRPPGYPSRLYPRSALLKYTISYLQLKHQKRGQRFVPGILGL